MGGFGLEGWLSVAGVGFSGFVFFFLRFEGRGFYIDFVEFLVSLNFFF